jgi:hypothetical protein
MTGVPTNVLPVLGAALPALPGLTMRPPGAASAPFSVATNVFNIRYASGWTYSESNMRAVDTLSTQLAILILPKQYGKWALEAEVVAAPGGGVMQIGMRAIAALAATSSFNQTGDYSYGSDGQKRNAGSASAYGPTYTTGDMITVLWNADKGTVSFAKNGVNQGEAFTGITTAEIPMFLQSNAFTMDIRISTTNTYAFPDYLQWR